MKILVTGSKGFVGKALCNKLQKRNFELIEVDLQLGHDVTAWSQISNLPQFDTVIHLAAKLFVPESFKNPASFYTTNFNGTLNTLELCRKYHAKMIYISSYVYGTPEYLPIDENHKVVAFNPYSQSKLMGEELCKAYNRDFDIPVTIFRPFNIYGSGQNPIFLIAQIIEQAKSGKIKLEDPRPRRDFIYLEDVVNAYEKAIYADFKNVEIFNLGSGISTSIQELTTIIQKILGRNVSIEFSGTERKNEVLDTVANIHKVKSLLNWTPQYSLEQGIEAILNN